MKKLTFKIICLFLICLFFSSCSLYSYNYLEFSATGSSTIEKVLIAIRLNKDKATEIEEIIFEDERLPFSYFEMVNGGGLFSIGVSDETLKEDGTRNNGTLTVKIYAQNKETHEYELKKAHSGRGYVSAIYNIW